MITDAQPTEADRDAQLALICEEISDRVRAGEVVNLDELAAKWPQYADELRDLVPAMRALAQLPVDASSAATFDQDLSLREPLGDFRIERGLGRGGMGVVYEAWQLSLQRRVALKVLPLAAVMDPRQLARFKNEALAAAALNHPHIVPVYGVGEARGTHYYAMQLIRGQNLAQVIAELRVGQGLDAPPTTAQSSSSDSPAGRLSREITPAAKDREQDTDDHRAALTKPSRGSSAEFAAYFRNVARIIRDAAEALGSAHAEGVIHRDVKPSNLMLDARGKLWVTDFGLAQMRGGDNLTMTGDLVGTLRYMSPEQVAGKHSPIDHRTDVYSLGATLYELLTLRPMHATEKQADLVHQIAQVEPLSPRRLRKEIPADLETIVQKMTAKSAGDRYATMRDVAEDLERFFNDQPIKAKPIGVVERTRRMARRYSASVAVALGASLFITTALGVAFRMTYVARDEAVAKAKEAEDKGKQLVKQNEQTSLAREAAIAKAKEAEVKGMELEKQNEQNKRVLHYLNQLLDHLADIDEGSPLKQAITTAERQFYEQFRNIDGDSIAGQSQLAASLHRLGKLQLDQNQFKQAEESFKQSIELSQELARREPNSARHNMALCRAWYLYANLAILTKKVNVAEHRALAAIDHGNKSLGQSPDDPAACQFLLSNCWEQLAIARQFQGRCPETLDACLSAIKLAEQVHVSRPQLSPEHLVQKLFRYTYCLEHFEQSRDLRKEQLARAIGELEVWRQGHPNDVRANNSVLQALTMMYDTEKDSGGDLNELLSKLEREFNTSHVSHDRMLMFILAVTGEVDATDRERQLALKLALRCVSMAPKHGQFLATLGMAQYRCGNYAESLVALEKACMISPSVDVWLFQVMCYQKLDQQDKAVALLKDYEARIEKEPVLKSIPSVKRLYREALELLGKPESSD